MDSGDLLINFGGSYSFFGQQLNAPAFVVDAKNRMSRIIILEDGVEKYDLLIDENLFQARMININNNQVELEKGKIIGDFRTKTDSEIEIDFTKYKDGMDTRYDFKLEVENDRLQFITKIFTKSEVSFILKNEKETLFFNQFVSNRFSKYNYTNISTKNLNNTYSAYVYIDSHLYLIRENLKIK